MAIKKNDAKKAELNTFDINTVGDDFVDLPGGFGQNWIPEKEGEVLEGRITGVSFGIQIPGQKKPGDVVQVRDGNGLDHSVWKSATITNLFAFGDSIIGKRVRFTYNGLGQKKKGQNPPKLIKVQLAK